MSVIGERILHVDMDAFFVEVERLNDPSLRGVPVVVGGLGGRGVVAAASYEARRAGVNSAMPMVEARRRLPHGRFLVPDRVAYSAASAAVFAVLESFTPRIEGLSIDEAFLDIGGLGLHFEDAGAVAAALRAAIRERTGLPASAGSATTKLVAKLASEQAKPDGQMVVPAGEELEFLWPLDVRSLWGVGEATRAALESMGVQTIGDLAALPEDLLRRRLGDALGAHLFALARNDDRREVTPGGEAKSISTEVTFDDDIVDEARLDMELFRLCASLSRRLRKAGVSAGTVSVKVRFSDLETVARSQSVPVPMDLRSDLYAAAVPLARRAGAGGRPVRLLGVAATSLVSRRDPRQLGLGGEAEEALAAASDDVTLRFGEDSLGPARLAPRPDPKRK